MRIPRLISLSHSTILGVTFVFAVEDSMNRWGSGRLMDAWLRFAFVSVAVLFCIQSSLTFFTEGMGRVKSSRVKHPLE